MKGVFNSDDHEPRHSHLLSSGQVEAGRRLAEIECIDREKLATLDQDTFLRAWWALHWLHPGLYPDDVEQWQNEAVVWKPLATEAYRRIGVSASGYWRDHRSPNTTRLKSSTTECG